MVRVSATAGRLLGCWGTLAACLLLAGLLPAAAAWANEVSPHSYDVEEEFTITLDAEGDAQYKDVLKYDAEFFNTNGFDFEKYPFLLSRRYKARAAVDEIQDFRADLDRQNATVTLTFGQRGRAYNMGDHWTVYGFGQKPDFAAEGQRVFQEESTVNSDYTLWQDLEFKTTTRVKLPAGATNVRWSKADEALLYDLAYVAPARGNILQRNQTVFIVLFAVLAAAALVVGAVAVTAARRGPVAAWAGAGATEVTATATPDAAAENTPVKATTTASATVDAAAVLPAGDTAEVAPPASANAPRAHFCRHCGAPLKHSDCRFCPDCGGRLSD